MVLIIIISEKLNFAKFEYLLIKVTLRYYSACIIIIFNQGSISHQCVTLAIFVIGECPELSHHLANGNITLSSPERLSGTTATYTCDSGYELNLTSGSEVRTCQANGTWSGSPLACVGMQISTNCFC